MTVFGLKPWQALFLAGSALCTGNLVQNSILLRPKAPSQATDKQQELVKALEAEAKKTTGSYWFPEDQEEKVK